MDFHNNNNNNMNMNMMMMMNSSPSSSHSSSMHSWWESISKARSRIHALIHILPSSESLLSLADSDRPALSLLSSPAAYQAISHALSSPHSGSGSDPLCQWLYDNFLSDDPHLRLLVLSYLPLLSGLYLSRIHSLSHSSSSLPSLAGFEAVLLALYAAQAKSRSGKPLLLTIPDLSQPSIYHSPINKPSPHSSSSSSSSSSVAVLSPPLEPQLAVKSTKRASIVGVALDSFYNQISQMPTWSKLELCRFAAGWAGQDCPCTTQFDETEVNGFESNEIEEFVEEMGNLEIQKKDESSKGARIPLPWELLQPVLRIMGHCLLGPLNSQDVKDAASFAVRCLYARASHDLVPQAILATRSLIQLDKRARHAAKAAATAANASSNANTPSKAKKPEVLLVSK